MQKKRILLKLTGEIFVNKDENRLTNTFIHSVIEQIKQLSDHYLFGIVVGGGNFFRGKEHGTQLGLTPSVGHQIGMLATSMNGLIITDMLEKQDLSACHLSAIACPEIGQAITQQTIDNALEKQQMLVFSGGTGNPFFTTDTNAVLRALQIKADEIWKGTSIDGVYDADPKQNKHAQLLKTLDFAYALSNKLGIMDTTSYALAQQHNQKVRIFNIFSDKSLIKAAENKDFGSIIQ